MVTYIDKTIIQPFVTMINNMGSDERFTVEILHHKIHVMNKNNRPKRLTVRDPDGVCILYLDRKGEYCSQVLNKDNLFDILYKLMTCPFYAVQK